jgi:hypothetical protein
MIEYEAVFVHSRIGPLDTFITIFAFDSLRLFPELQHQALGFITRFQVGFFPTFGNLRGATLIF